jgi:hypothetical protein
MDILSWTKLNPEIQFQQTQKQYYGKYLYRAVLQAPGGRSLNDKISVEHYLSHRLKKISELNPDTWYAKRLLHEIKDHNPNQLNNIKSVIKNHSTQVRVRVEEPLVQIYTETEQDLLDILSDIEPEFRSSIISVAGPSNEKDAKLLKQNVILIKKSHEYTHKVFIRDGRYNIDVLHTMLDYLDSLEDQVKVHRGTRDQINRSNGYIWNCWFYTKDPDIVTFIQLMDPNLVRNIHPLVFCE